VLEFINFWLAKYAASFIIFIAFVTILIVSFAIWFAKRYYIFNYSKAARHIRFLIETNVKNNNGVTYERLAFDITQYSGVRIFDSVVETSEPTRLNLFIYNYKKLLNKKIIYSGGLIYHKDSLDRINLNEQY